MSNFVIFASQEYKVFRVDFLHADKTLHYQHLELFWESCETLKCCF
jgi:hypothetical protein